RGSAEAFGPQGPHELVVAPDPARGDDHGLSPQLEVPGHLAARGGPARRRARGEERAAHADDGALGHEQLVDPVAEGEAHEAALDPLTHRRGEGLDEGRPGAPGDVEARHGVAVPAREPTAALGPADHGEEADLALLEVGALLPGGELDVGARPAATPQVRLAVELRRAEPVLPREVHRVVDPHAALLGGVHEEEPAEGPPGLAPEALLALLVHEDHALA